MTRNKLSVVANIARDAASVDYGVFGDTKMALKPEITSARSGAKSCPGCAGTGVAYVAWSKDIDATVVYCYCHKSARASKILNAFCLSFTLAVLLVLIFAGPRL
ncbi:hypothetical protein [Sphingomonas sp. UYP23]